MRNRGALFARARMTTTRPAHYKCNVSDTCTATASTIQNIGRHHRAAHHIRVTVITHDPFAALDVCYRSEPDGSGGTRCRCTAPGCDYTCENTRILATHYRCVHHAESPIESVLVYNPQSGHDDDAPLAQTEYRCKLCAHTTSLDSIAADHYYNVHAQGQQQQQSSWSMYPFHTPGAVDSRGFKGPQDCDAQRGAELCHQHQLDFPRPARQQLQLGGNDNVVKRVEQFRYLGRILSVDNNDAAALDARIAAANLTFKRLQPAFCANTMRRADRMRIYKAMV